MQSVRTPLAARALRVLSVVAVALVAACSSTPAKGPSDGGRLTFVTWPSGRALQLVSDEWIAGSGYQGDDVEERRAAFYRQNVYRADGSTPAVKVCEDAVFDGVLQALTEQGYERYASAGAAPASPGTPCQVLELTRAGATTHFVGAKGMDPERKMAFLASATVFTEVFNAIPGFQSGDEQFRFKE